MVHEFKPCVGLCADSSEPGVRFGFCVSLSLCPSLACTFSLPQKEINIKKKIFFFFFKDSKCSYVLVLTHRGSTTVSSSEALLSSSCLPQNVRVSGWNLGPGLLRLSQFLPPASDVSPVPSWKELLGGKKTSLQLETSAAEIQIFTSTLLPQP